MIKNMTTNSCLLLLLLFILITFSFYSVFSTVCVQAQLLEGTLPVMWFCPGQSIKDDFDWKSYHPVHIEKMCCRIVTPPCVFRLSDYIFLYFAFFSWDGLNGQFECSVCVWCHIMRWQGAYMQMRAWSHASQREHEIEWVVGYQRAIMQCISILLPQLQVSDTSVTHNTDTV